MQRSASVRIYRNAEVQPQYTTDMHTHPQHELYFLLSGQRRYFIGQSIYDVSPGNLVIVPKHQLHKTNSAGKLGYDRYVLFFADEDLQDFIATLGKEHYSRLINSGCLLFPPDVAKAAQNRLEQMHRCFCENAPFKDAFLVNELRCLLLTALQQGKPCPPCTGESADKIQQAAGYISDNFHLPLTLHQCAQLACMESTYFSKRFKALTGLGFQEYLTGLRLQKAKLLLQSTSLSIGEIAEQCGFSGSNYFGDAFHKHTGISPTDYRNRSAKE